MRRVPVSRRFLLALSTLVVTACATGVPEVPAGPDGQRDEVLVVGRDVYRRNCVNCHANDGGGGKGAKLKDGAVVEKYPDAADQAAVIRNGRGQMPSFDGRLTDAEIDAVVRFTREVLR